MKDQTIRALTEFASKVFNEPFFEDGRHHRRSGSAIETLGRVVDLFDLPSADRVN